MELEIVILSEVIQTEKGKYHTISLTHGILKKKWCKWIYLQNRNGITVVKNKRMVTRQEGRRNKFRDWDWHIHKSVSHWVVTSSATLWTLAHQPPLSMGFSRQEHWREIKRERERKRKKRERKEPWSGFPSPRGSPQPRPPTLQVNSLPSEPPGKSPHNISYFCKTTNQVQKKTRKRYSEHLFFVYL